MSRPLSPKIIGVINITRRSETVRACCSGVANPGAMTCRTSHGEATAARAPTTARSKNTRLASEEANRHAAWRC